MSNDKKLGSYLAINDLPLARDCAEYAETLRTNNMLLGAADLLERAAIALTRKPAPIDMVLHCPVCGLQHVDRPDQPWSENARRNAAEYGVAPWTNPPHRSHLCHGCGYIWRPADVPTNGVLAVQTKGSNDEPMAPPVVVFEAAKWSVFAQAFDKGVFTPFLRSTFGALFGEQVE